jgi:hypothetical protein
MGTLVPVVKRHVHHCYYQNPNVLEPIFQFLLIERAHGLHHESVRAGPNDVNLLAVLIDGVKIVWNFDIYDSSIVRKSNLWWGNFLSVM